MTAFHASFSETLSLLSNATGKGLFCNGIKENRSVTEQRLASATERFLLHQYDLRDELPDTAATATTRTAAVTYAPTPTCTAIPTCAAAPTRASAGATASGSAALRVR